MAIGVDTGACFCFHLVERQGVARTHHSQNQTFRVYLRAAQRTMTIRTLKDSGVCGSL